MNCFYENQDIKWRKVERYNDDTLKEGNNGENLREKNTWEEFKWTTLLYQYTLEWKKIISELELLSRMFLFFKLSLQGGNYYYKKNV
jgi:hypothetical protein